jgi:hypothetical protein
MATIATTPGEERCADHAALAYDLAKAIREVYLRKQAYYAVKAKREDTSELWETLQAARISQVTAEHAFNEHIDQHRCNN